MEITYQHANPRSGNESFLLRVRERHESRTPCILVDAGDGVAVDDLLGEDEYLAAILLTHAHVDHYRSLDDAHRDGAPIITSPGTAAILEDVFTEGARHYGLGETDALLRQVEGITDWYDVVGDAVSVHPVPAGHAPGACGFLVRIGDGDDRFVGLVTGDFTRRDAAGYPGFDPSDHFDVDAVFLTAATNEDFEDDLTDAVGTLVQRATAGSTTLCTASGLTGVHLAALLAGVGRELDRSVPVLLAGQVAKLYEGLDYDHAAVETVPTYSDPTDCLEPGAVTIAGPEVPVEGSSARLFRSIEDDPNATIVQVQGGNTDAKDAGDASGTVSSTAFANHPAEAVLDDVVETLSPTHVVVEHQHGRANDRYKDKWDAYTWATGDGAEQTLFRDGSLVAPPWVGEKTHSRVRGRDGSQTVLANNAELLDELSPPAIERRDRIGLEAEGIDLSRLRERLRTGRPSTATPATAARAGNGGGAADTTQQSAATDGGLYRTTGAKLDGGASASIEVDDEEDGDAPGTLYDTVSASVSSTPEAGPSDADPDAGGAGSSESAVQAGGAATDTASKPADESADEPGGSPDADDEATGADGSEGDSGSGATGDAAESADSPVRSAESADSSEASTESPSAAAASTESDSSPATSAEPGDTPAEPAGDEADSDTDQRPGEDRAGDDVTGDAESGADGEPEAEVESAVEVESDAGRQSSDRAADDGAAEDGAATERPTTEIEVDPVVRSLVVDCAESVDGGVDAVVAGAVEDLLAAVLRGDGVDLEPAAPEAVVELDPALEQVIGRAAPDDGVTAAFVRRTLCEGLGVDPDERTLTVAGLDALAPLVDAVGTNDEFPVDDHDRIVQVALERRVLDQ